MKDFRKKRLKRKKSQNQFNHKSEGVNNRQKSSKNLDEIPKRIQEKIEETIQAPLSGTFHGSMQKMMMKRLKAKLEAKTEKRSAKKRRVELQRALEYDTKKDKNERRQTTERGSSNGTPRTDNSCGKHSQCGKQRRGITIEHQQRYRATKGQESYVQ
jgi:hypothetical protein